MNGQATVNYHLSFILRLRTSKNLDISRKQSINRYNWLYLLRIKSTDIMANFLFLQVPFRENR